MNYKDILQKNEVQTIIHYPIPPHRQECYKDWNDIKLPITERIHAEELSLPISPVISSHDINFIIELINNKTW